jgi:hypothetical protein
MFVESGTARGFLFKLQYSLSPLVALRTRAPDSTPEQLTGTTVLSRWTGKGGTMNAKQSGDYHRRKAGRGGM